MPYVPEVPFYVTGMSIGISQALRRTAAKNKGTKPIFCLLRLPWKQLYRPSFSFPQPLACCAQAGSTSLLDVVWWTEPNGWEVFASVQCENLYMASKTICFIQHLSSECLYFWLCFCLILIQALLFFPSVPSLLVKLTFFLISLEIR